MKRWQSYKFTPASSLITRRGLVVYYTGHTSAPLSSRVLRTSLHTVTLASSEILLIQGMINEGMSATA